MFVMRWLFGVSSACMRYNCSDLYFQGRGLFHFYLVLESHSLLLTPSSRFADNVLILSLVFTDNQRHLFFVNFFKAKTFQDLS